MMTSDSADRVNLSQLLQRHPQRSTSQLAHVLSRSVSWVKKWKRLFQTASTQEELESILRGTSCVPKHPPARVHPLLEEMILAIRDQPPEGLRRIPGPKAIQ